MDLLIIKLHFYIKIVVYTSNMYKSMNSALIKITWS